MTWSEDELLEAFRAECGPDATARARLEARIDEAPRSGSPKPQLEPAPHRVHPWVLRGAVATIAVAAAIAGTCALTPRGASELASDVPALVPDAMESDRHETAHAKAPRSTGAARSVAQKLPPPEHAVASKSVPEAPVADPRPAAVPSGSRSGHSARASSDTPNQGRRRPTPPVDTEPQPRATSITEEAAAIGRARAALTKGNAQAALDHIAAYRKRFPQPILGEEAAAVAAMATCHGATAKVAAASALAFSRAHARSLFRKQVERTCAVATEKKPPMQRPREHADIQE